MCTLRNTLTLLLILVTFASAACSIRPELDLTLQESDRGAAYLERMSDRSFQAAHPIKLAPDIIARVLRGVLVKDEQRLLQNLLVGKPDAVRVFRDDEVDYLAPLLVEGLSRAASDQQVGFRITQTGAPMSSQAVAAGVGSSEPPLRPAPPESTSGALYAYGRSLYLTVTHYRYRTERADTINMANRRIPDPTGLANRTVLFIPESAKRPDSYRDARSTKSTLVIDYELLATLPTTSGSLPQSSATPPPTAGTTPAASQQPAPVQDHTSQKDADVEALRKELQEIKQKLAEQEAERALLQPQQPSKQKSQSIP